MSKPKKEFTRLEKLKFTFFTIFIILFLIIGIGEVLTRIVTDSNAQQYSDKSLIDSELGWIPKEGYKSEYKMSEYGKGGATYNVQYHTEKNGFKEWGDVNSNRQKLLFIGDSYVQSVEVSNDKTFYHLIGDSLDVEVFAFGQAGYGTLQQKLILDKYINEINPDLIVLQTCDNDFIDNHAPLEYNSKYKVGLRRPYYTTAGKTTYRKAMPVWQESIDKSKFLGVIRKKLQTTFASKSKKSSQDLMAELKNAYKPYAESQQITELILKDMKKSAGNIPIIAFSASAYEPQLSDFQRASENAGIPFNNKPGTEIMKMKWDKRKVHSKDGYHWSEKGQLIVAELLIKTISSALNTQTTNSAK